MRLIFMGTPDFSVPVLEALVEAEAEALGVEIYPGFAAAEVLYNDDGSVKGVATGDMGVGKNGEPKDGYMPRMELLGKYTFFAEGVRGSLSKHVINNFNLDADSEPQRSEVRRVGIQCRSRFSPFP